MITAWISPFKGGLNTFELEHKHNIVPFHVPHLNIAINKITSVNTLTIKQPILWLHFYDITMWVILVLLNCFHCFLKCSQTVLQITVLLNVHKQVSQSFLSILKIKTNKTWTNFHILTIIRYYFMSIHENDFVQS